jgi:hypothetical protein
MKLWQSQKHHEQRLVEGQGGKWVAVRWLEA